MEIIMKLIRALFRLETNADVIFAPLDKIVKQAEAHASDQSIRAADEAEKARKLQEKIDARQAEITKTQKRAANVKKLMELAE